MTQAEALLLSLLGPRPAFFQNPKFPDILCAWNGVVMTRSHALMLASELFWNQGPTPEMRYAADRKLLLLYQAGAFENSESWAPLISSNTYSGCMHQWYRLRLKPHIDRTLSGTRPYEVFQWFDFAQWCKNESKNT